MRLIEVLTTYLVMSSTYDVVGWHTDGDDADPHVSLSWEEGGLEYRVEVEDQDITPFDQESSRGMFSVTDVEGEDLILIALQEVELPS